MKPSYVCVSCQLRRSLWKHSRAILQQKQWFSQSTRQSQDRIEHSFRHSSSITQSQFDRKHKTLQRNERVGRYSNQPLAPHILLDELNEFEVTPIRPEQTEPGRHHAARREANRDVTTIDGDFASQEMDPDLQRPSNISLDLWHHYSRFLRAAAGKHGTVSDDQEALDVLKSICRTYRNTEELKFLGKDAQFDKQVFLLLGRINKRWSDFLIKGPGTGRDVIRPSETLALLALCNAKNVSHYPRTLWSEARPVLMLVQKTDPVSRKRLQEGVKELMRSWSLSMNVRLNQATPLPQNLTFDIDWSFLPDPHEFGRLLRHQRRAVEDVRPLSFLHTLNTFLPEQAISSKRVRSLLSRGMGIHDYSSAALVTLDVLQRLETEPDFAPFVTSQQPWMQLMKTTFEIIADRRIPPALAQITELSPMHDVYRAVIKRVGLQNPVFSTETSADRRKSRSATDRKLPTARSQSTHGSSQAMLPSSVEEKSVDQSESVAQFVHTAEKRLGRAEELLNLDAVQQVYDDARKFLMENKQAQLPITFYENLARFCFSVRNSRLAANVWNDLIKAGHQPTVKTYTIMMHGCQELRDQAAMEEFWRRMRDARLQPDRYAWSTRIRGLMRNKTLTKAGMQALEDMGKDWIAAAKAAYTKNTLGKGKSRDMHGLQVKPAELLARYEGDVDGVARPDVVVMNSAITTLAANRVNLVPKVLTWGRVFGIEPNLATYNTLLNISMRNGLPDDATSIMHRMNEKGIEANSETWTVILTGMFEGTLKEETDGDAAAEQILSFMKSIDDMPGSGLDEKAYALVVNRLLKVYNNPSAAQKVLESMIQKGQKPNVHLYTILMTSYFERDPPNFDAIEKLWTQMSADKAGAALDNIFFDRMIEKCAMHHKSIGIRPMLLFIERMEAQGKSPSWKALDGVARALADAGELQRLTHLVAKVGREKKDPTGGGRFGSREFWKFVQSTGVTR